MGKARIIVPCSCQGRAPLPPSPWGLEQSEHYFLSETQKELLGQWLRARDIVICAHPRGERDATSARDLLVLLPRLALYLPRSEFPLVRRLRSPGLDFSGDCVVLPPGDTALLAGELEKILQECWLYQLPPTPDQLHRSRTAHQTRDEERATLTRFLVLVRLAIVESQPLLIR
jgi:hypothetical protein